MSLYATKPAPTALYKLLSLLYPLSNTSPNISSISEYVSFNVFSTYLFIIFSLSPIFTSWKISYSAVAVIILFSFILATISSSILSSKSENACSIGLGICSISSCVNAICYHSNTVSCSGSFFCASSSVSP